MVLELLTMVDSPIAGDAINTGADALQPLFVFLWAAGGSLALEVISLYNEIKAERATGLPGYYKNPLFWFVRLLVTGIAGGLAVAEKAASPLIAINIGASAPAILQLLTNPPKTPPQSRATGSAIVHN